MKLTSRSLSAIAVLLLAAESVPYVAAAPTVANASASTASEPSLVTKPASGASTFREIKWAELMPKGWDPSEQFRGRNTTIRSDMDPRARELMAEVRAVWDTAPTVPGLEGEIVKLPGYVVPLEEQRGELKEFLLVPYFGACIHTPPPPANQIVFVVASKGVKFRAMDTVWVSGTLHTTRQESYMGASGYRIEATNVDRYVSPEPK